MMMTKYTSSPLLLLLIVFVNCTITSSLPPSVNLFQRVLDTSGDGKIDWNEWRFSKLVDMEPVHDASGGGGGVVDREVCIYKDK